MTKIINIPPGDMQQVIYDINNDGVVDNSEQLGGQDPLFYTQTGLEQIDEGNGAGWRLIGQDAFNYGNIGAGAVDISISTGVSSIRGATGSGSFASGSDNAASGTDSAVFGTGNTASGTDAMAFGVNSSAEGSNSLAHGNVVIARLTNDHAQGDNTEAKGGSSHAEGIGTIASGVASHAEGESGAASGYASHAEGTSIAAGDYSHSEGQLTGANALGAHAEGDGSTADGVASHAEGQNTIATGIASHVEGIGSTTLGLGAHAEGNLTGADGNYAHSEGTDTTADGVASHAEGSGSASDGNFSHAGGVDTVSSGAQSFAHGDSSIASANSSVSMGVDSVASNEGSAVFGKYANPQTADTILSIGIGITNITRADGLTSFTDGTTTAPESTLALINSRGPKTLITKEFADATYSAGGIPEAPNDGQQYGRQSLAWTVVGAGGTPTGFESITENTQTGWRLIGRDPANYGNIGDNALDASTSTGPSTTFGATGQYSAAFNAFNIASGQNSSAFGGATEASGQGAFTMGLNTVAIGVYSLAVGGGSVATGDFSMAVGELTEAQGTYTFVSGQNTIAQNNYQATFGRFNIGTSISTILEVGMGVADLSRANAFELFDDGTATLPEATIAEITSRGSKALITKEYGDANYSGAGGQVDSVVSGTDITVDATDPINPIVNFTGTYFTPTTLLADYSFTDNSINWNIAFGWGDHSGIYSLLGHSHVIGDVTGLQVEIDTKEDSLGNPTTDGDIVSSTAAGVRTWITPASGGGSPAFDINQVTHGFSIGDAVAEVGGTWQAADTSISDNTSEGIVIEVVDVDNFKATVVGELELTAHGYAVDSWLYLLANGTFSVTPPSVAGEIIQYCFKTLDINRIYINISQPEFVAAASIPVVEEAPIDGTQYARKDAAWDAVPAGIAPTEGLIETNDFAANSARNYEVLTQLEYNGLGTPDANSLYFIV